MLRCVRQAALCQALLLPTASFAVPCVWYADQSAIHQVAAEDRPTQSASLPRAQVLAPAGSDCSAWVLAGKQLLRYDANAKPVRAIELSSITKSAASMRTMVAAPRTRGVWLSDEKTVFHLDATGQLLASWDIQSGTIEALAAALDGSIWVLGNKQLWQYSAEGALITTLDLHKIILARPKLITVDSVGKILWLAGEKQLTRIDLSQPQYVAKSLALASTVADIELNSRSGELWISLNDRLLSYRRDGSEWHTVDTDSLGLENVQRLAFDSESRTLWLSGKSTLIQLSEQGNFLSKMATEEKVEAIGAPAFTVTPTLALVRPAQDGITNNPQPTISFEYDARCNDQPCGFDGTYYESYSMSAVLNQQPISPFVFNTTSRQANYTPSVRLPEGINTISAQVEDRFGQLSDIASNQFNIDTVAPEFLNLSPADGAVSTSPQVLIQGSVDDVEATVLINVAGQSATAAGKGTREFSYPFILAPGLNVVTVTAIDKAGNANSTTLRLTYNPVSVSIDSPSNGETVEGVSTSISGTFQGPPNSGVTVNGIIATINGDRFFANVPLKAGENQLIITVTTQAGLTASQMVTVVSSGPREIEIAADGTSGFAPFSVSFEIENNAAKTLSRIEADFDGNGITDLTTTDPNAPLQFVYTTPGAYNARIKITDSNGMGVERLITVYVQDAAQADQLLKNQWAKMNAALVQGDRVQALSFITEQSRSSYGSIFEKLLPYMPAIVASYSPLQTVSLKHDIGEFAINRTADGVNHIYFVYFLRGQDGVWRIDAM